MPMSHACSVSRFHLATKSVHDIPVHQAFQAGIAVIITGPTTVISNAVFMSTTLVSTTPHRNRMAAQLLAQRSLYMHARSHASHVPRSRRAHASKQALDEPVPIVEYRGDDKALHSQRRPHVHVSHTGGWHTRRAAHTRYTPTHSICSEASCSHPVVSRGSTCVTSSAYSTTATTTTHGHRWRRKRRHSGYNRGFFIIATTMFTTLAQHPLARDVCDANQREVRHSFRAQRV